MAAGTYSYAAESVAVCTGNTLAHVHIQLKSAIF